MKKRRAVPCIPLWVGGLLLLCLTGCATGMHGTFVAESYQDPLLEGEGRLLGKVQGSSSQTFFLYLFPMGDSPSTHAAVEDAKQQIPGTRFLTDLSIDDREYWKIGYKRKVIEVDATARD